MFIEGRILSAASNENRLQGKALEIECLQQIGAGCWAKKQQKELSLAHIDGTC